MTPQELFLHICEQNLSVKAYRAIRNNVKDYKQFVQTPDIVLTYAGVGNVNYEIKSIIPIIEKWGIIDIEKDVDIDESIIYIPSSVDKLTKLSKEVLWSAYNNYYQIWQDIQSNIFNTKFSSIESVVKYELRCFFLNITNNNIGGDVLIAKARALALDNFPKGLVYSQLDRSENVWTFLQKYEKGKFAKCQVDPIYKQQLDKLYSQLRENILTLLDFSQDVINPFANEEYTNPNGKIINTRQAFSHFLGTYFDKSTTNILKFQYKNPNGLIKAIASNRLKRVNEDDIAFLKGWGQIAQNRNYYSISNSLFSLLSAIYLPSYIIHAFKQYNITSIHKFFRLEKRLPKLCDFSEEDTLTIKRFSDILVEYSILHMCNNLQSDDILSTIKQSLPKYMQFQALSNSKKEYVNKVYELLISRSKIEKYYPYVSDILCYRSKLENNDDEAILRIQKCVNQTIDYIDSIDEDIINDFTEIDMVNQMADIMWNANTKDSHLLWGYLIHLLGYLTKREAEIIMKIWGEDNKQYTFEDIGNDLGLTRERIGQIYDKGIRKLRNLYITPNIAKIDIYQFGDLDYISPETVNFNIDEIYTEAKFFIFSQFLSLVIYPEHYTNYSFVKINHSNVNTQHYAVNKRFSRQFDFSKLFTYIKEHYSNSLDNNIVLNTIITKRKFWKDKTIHTDLLEGIKSFVAYICTNYFELQVTDITDSNIELAIEQMTLDTVAVKNYLVELLSVNSPMTLNELYAKSKDKFPLLKSKSVYVFRSLLSDKSLFQPIGRKSLYQLTSSDNFSGSVTKCIDRILIESDKPIKLDSLIEQVLSMRPDSNFKSVRSVITNRIKSNELIMYIDSYVGLMSKIDTYSLVMR